eukprot:gene10372-12714_t
MTDNLNLVGRWDIVSWEQRYDDGRLVLPMGERLEGFLLYSPEGSMTCLIARSERPKFPSGLQWEATEAEKAQAYEGILSYGGTYKVSGDTVEHHVSVSAFPNWDGGGNTAGQNGRIDMASRFGEDARMSATVDSLARKLRNAADSRTPCPPIRDEIEKIRLAANEDRTAVEIAYEVQCLNTAYAQANGRRLVG